MYEHIHPVHRVTRGPPLQMKHGMKQIKDYMKYEDTQANSYTLNYPVSSVPFFLQCDNRAPQESPANPEPMMITSASVGTSSLWTTADKECVTDPLANLAGAKALAQDTNRHKQTFSAN